MAQQMIDICERFTQQMSLRRPQAESLEILDKVAEVLSFSKNPDIASDLAAIKELGYPIKDFDRDFPSLCFSIATGVGKTRLMGAFVSYLYITKGIKNFFVIAPNLTIYNKLISDFRDISSPKYVFNGIPEFATNRPVVVTGDDYQHMAGLTRRAYEDRVKINIFNISKINRQGEARTRFRSFSEVLGESYFDYLQSLPDLVLIMDEAHRYRAQAGMAIINELQPVLGLELTATAHDERGVQFNNVIYHYALAQAVNDKFVKKPAIVGRTNFDKNAYDDDKLEEIKLVDGFKVHEDTKAELEVYAAENNVRLVKPFLLVVARDTNHANALKEKIDSDAWLDGRYKNKTIVVHSNQRGAEQDENIAQLLEVEKTDNPIEVVIHVNMLAEGWDVNNLYTIVPLRAADSKTLVEQSIGRGLRLPYGKHTGVDSIDRLNIVAHDKFAEIVKIAEEQGFKFQQIALANDNDAGNKIAVENPSAFMTRILEGNVKNDPDAPATVQGLFNLEKPDVATKKLMVQIGEEIEEKIKVVANVNEVVSESRIAEIAQEVVRKNTEGSLALDDDAYKNRVHQMTKTLTKQFVESQIQIPPIRIVRTVPSVGVKYNRFALDLTPFNDLKPVRQNILIKDLLENKRKEEQEATFTELYPVLSHYIIIKLMDYLPCTSTEDIDLLEFFATQVVEHIKTYAPESDVAKILFFNNERIAQDIASQAEMHKEMPAVQTTVKGMNDNYVFLRMRPSRLLGDRTEGEVSFRTRPQVLSKIRSLVFTNFEKCLSSKAKFDSDTERQFAVLLEDTTEVVRWERLCDEQAKDAFNLRYKKENEGLAAYCPDFVVETTTDKYIVETKSADNMTDNDVLAKKEIATKWCAEASKYEAAHGGKPWTYLLVPHNDLDPTRTLEQLVVDWSAK